MNSELHVVATSICASAKYKTNANAALEGRLFFFQLSWLFAASRTRL
jgi:hypothetical protein